MTATSAPAFASLPSPIAAVWLRWLGCLLALSLPLASADNTTSSPQATGESLALYSRMETLHTLRHQRRQLDAQWETEKAQLEEGIAKLRDARDATLNALAEQQASRDDLLARAGAMEAEVRRADAWLDEIADKLVPLIDALDAMLAAGIPHRREERRETLAESRAGLDDVTFPPRVAAIANLLSFLDTELQRANSISMWNEAILMRHDNRRIHGHHLRLGLAAQIFLSEDKQFAALALNGASEPWTTPLTAARRQSVAEAVSMFSRLSAPTLLPLPLPVPLSTFEP